MAALTSLLDTIKDHAIITNQKGIILYANAAAEKHTGFSREEMIGRKPQELWGGLMPEEFYDKMWKQILSGKSFTGEIRNRKKTGAIRWQELYIFPFYLARYPMIFMAIEPDMEIQETRNLGQIFYASFPLEFQEPPSVCQFVAWIESVLSSL